MKKIVCLLLCVFVFASTFLVYAGAEDKNDTEDVLSSYADYSALDKTTVVSKAESEGFSNFVNVDAYFNNAGSDGYKDFQLVGITKPTIDPENKTFTIEFYFYNPMLLPFKYDGTYISAGAKVIPYLDTNRYGFVSNYFKAEYSPEGTTVYNEMFIRGTFEGTFPGTELVSGVCFDVDKLWFDLYDENYTNDAGNAGKLGSYDFLMGEQKKLSLQNITDYIFCSSPIYDLCSFLELTEAELLEKYPKVEGEPGAVYDNGRVIFLLEQRELDCLYLYVYDEEGFDVKNFDYIHWVELAIDDAESKKMPAVRIQDVDIISGEGNFAKLRVNNVSDVFPTAFSGQDRSKFYVDAFRYGDAGNVTDSGDNFYECTITVEGDKTSVFSNDGHIELEDVNHTYYRLNGSKNGANYYQTLSTIYFSIPREYYELEDDDVFNNRWIESMMLEYTKHYINPGIVTSDKDLYNRLVASSSGQEPIFIGQVGSSAANGDTMVFRFGIPGSDFLAYSVPEVAKYIYDGFLQLQNSTEQNRVLVTEKLFDKPSFVIYVEDLDVDYFMTSEELRELLEASGDLFLDEGEYYNPTLNREEVKNLFSGEEMTFSQVWSQTSLFEAWLHNLGVYNDWYDDTILNIPVFQTLHEAEMAQIYNGYADIIKNAFNSNYSGPTSDEYIKNICGQYFIAEEDFGDFLLKIFDAIVNKESLNLVRFDTYDYYSTDDVWLVDTPAFDTNAIQEVYYKNLDVLKVELKNSYDSKFYTADMDPISFVAGSLTPALKPQLPFPDFNLPDWEVPDWNFRIPWPEMPDFSWVLTVFTVILVILGLFILWPILSWFFRLIFGPRKKK